MKNYYIVILLLISVFVVSCTDSVEKYDNWPEWKTQDPVTVAGEKNDRDILYSLCREKTSFDKGGGSRFYRIRRVRVCFTTPVLGIYVGYESTF